MTKNTENTEVTEVTETIENTQTTEQTNVETETVEPKKACCGGKKCETKKGVCPFLCFVMLLLVATGSFFAGKYLSNGSSKIEGNTIENIEQQTNNEVNAEQPTTPEVKAPVAVDPNLNKDLEVTIILDKNCGEECEKLQITPENLTAYFKQAPFLVNSKITVLDVSEANAKKILKDSEVKLVPAVFFSSNTFDDTVEGKSIELAKSMVATKGGLYEFPSKGFFNIETKLFTQEVSCDNKKDDDKNGKIDCKDEACATSPICAPKTEVKAPVTEEKEVKEVKE